MKLVSLLFLLKNDKILLAMKKRGFGAGKWNGVGGKADPGEDAAQAAIRECQEEIGVTPIDPRFAGNLKFYKRDDPSFGHDCHIFTATEWRGEPVETEEMRPQWFNIKDTPYKQMWPDDELWLPLLLGGKLFKGNVTTDGNNELTSHDIKVVKSLTEGT
jgi:8-oxo-dGTP diphosphatase